MFEFVEFNIRDFEGIYLMGVCFFCFIVLVIRNPKGILTKVQLNDKRIVVYIAFVIAS